MKEDAEAGRLELLYISFLWPFVDTLLLLEYVTRIRALPREHALYIQQRVLACLDWLDGAKSTCAGRRARNELDGLMLEGDAPAARPAVSWAAPLEATLEAYRNCCVQFDPAVLRAVEGDTQEKV